MKDIIAAMLIEKFLEQKHTISGLLAEELSNGSKEDRLSFATAINRFYKKHPELRKRLFVEVIEDRRCSWHASPSYAMFILRKTDTHVFGFDGELPGVEVSDVSKIFNVKYNEKGFAVGSDSSKKRYYFKNRLV